MAKSDPDGIGGVLLELYRFSGEMAPSAFQDATLDLFRRVVPFDSSMWGSATLSDQGININAIHLYKQPIEMLEEYEAVKHLDVAAQKVSQIPTCTMGFDKSHIFAGPEFEPIRQYGKKFGQHHFFISADTKISAASTQWITFFRAHEREPGTLREKHLIEQIVPHALQALKLNRQRFVDKKLLHQRYVGAYAVCSQRGFIYESNAEFQQILIDEWPVRSHSRLPDQLWEAMKSGQPRFKGAACLIVGEVDHGMLFLRARRLCPADALTGRERIVADLYAAGRTHKEIAQHLERSPATIRNQIQAIYEKLEVVNVVQLAGALGLAPW